jgi:hypothetical protein
MPVAANNDDVNKDFRYADRSKRAHEKKLWSAKPQRVAASAAICAFTRSRLISLPTISDTCTRSKAQPHY